jgi:hypothetical protein
VNVGTYDPGDHPGDGTAKIDVDPDLVRFADLNGDGRDDYLVVSSDSKVRAYLNFAGTDGHLRFVHHGIAFQEEPFNRANLRFADVIGDGRDDILRVSAEGAVHAFLNRGGGGNGSFEPRHDWAHASDYRKSFEGSHGRW